ncbi:MAG: type II secretion system GspH family protein [bacterium]|nr:type II secretion system GspH family protein [bacterium]
MKINLNSKLKSYKYNKGMTFIEIVVVMSIFAIISGVSLFNYKHFQAKVDLKNLTTNIALKILTAQKDSASGKLNPLAASTWKPSYGLYFDLSTSSPLVVGNKIFYIYSDFNAENSREFDVAPISGGSYNCVQECVERVNITNGNYIFDIIDSAGNSLKAGQFIGCSGQAIDINFTRPNFGPVFHAPAIGVGCPWTLTYIDIIIASPVFPTPVAPAYANTARVRLHASGRIEVR